MKDSKPSIDGFIPRRANSQVGERHVVNASTVVPARKQLRSEDDLQKNAIGAPRPGRVIGRADIDDSLRELDEPDAQQPTRKMSRREKRRWKKENRTRKQTIRRRIILGVVWVIVALLIGVGGYLAYKTLNATGHVLNGSFVDLIQNVPLKEDENGRSNFLIVGTSEDDPGHDAGYLTDSIMIMSINQKNKDAYMFSIPRDLYVEYGSACKSGYRGKINAYFACANTGEDDAAEQDRLQKTQKFIGDIVGLDIQYGVHVNYTVMRDVVNAIGGEIQVTINSRNPNGVMDSNFDWKCGPNIAKRKQTCPPNGHYIDYPNGPVTLDAEHALYLAQARGDKKPTYGFEQSNFDRERNQQMIAVAIRDKAMSAGALTNLGTITGLIDALDKNLRTNIATKEIRTLMDLAQNIKNENIKSLDFYNEENRLFTSGPLDGVSTVYPSAGLYKYSDLRAFIKKQLNSEPFMKEEPHVSVMNGSGEPGIGQSTADLLEQKGFTIDTVGNAPDGTYGKIDIYQINAEKTATAAKLAEYFGVTIKKTTPPVSVVGETDFLIIVGDASVIRSKTSS